jgi:hypothetical protein
MANAGTIKVETIEEMVEIVAGLVKEGVIFNACKLGEYWSIEMTGGI